MAERVRSLSRRARYAWGLVCIALGLYPVSLALGLIPFDEGKVAAPMWVVALSGFVFLIGGLMLLLADYARANNLLAGVLCLVFGVAGAWVSLFGHSDGFSGGFMFLSNEQNVTLGRWVFGLGALMCFATSAYAFRRAAQSSR